MDLLTDKPTGGVIDVTLSWPAPPDSRLWRYIDRLLMVLWLCGWTPPALVWPAGQLANGNLTFFLVDWVGFWALCGGLSAWALLVSFRPPRPESVRLESGGLRHDPGGRSRCWGRRQGWEPIRVARSDVREFVLESVEGRSRLYLDRGIDRLEIGAGLREPDREWLVAVLQRWHSPNHSLQQRPPPCWFLEVHSRRRRPLLSVVVRGEAGRGSLTAGPARSHTPMPRAPLTPDESFAQLQAGGTAGTQEAEEVATEGEVNGGGFRLHRATGRVLIRDADGMRPELSA